MTFASACVCVCVCVWRGGEGELKFGFNYVRELDQNYFISQQNFGACTSNDAEAYHSKITVNEKRKM